MSENMTVKVGVCAWGADPAGISLLNGEEGEWESGIIKADSDLHWEVEMVLAEHDIAVPDGVLEEFAKTARHWAVAVHSTSATEPGAAWPSGPGGQWSSWRPSSTSVIHTYMVAVDVDGYVKDEWPDARPVTLALAEAVDRPPSHEPTAAPVPREVDVMFHGLRHIRNLIDTDDANADAFGELWRHHIQQFRPALARMYHRKRIAA